jgi:[ribosomal protein S5]-alanine N-acetyltransferase
MKSERLLIRRFAVSDLADFLAYQADPVVRRHLHGDPMTPDQAATYLATQARLAEDALDSWHGYAVELLAEQRVIGDVGVWLPAPAGSPGDVGFQFHPEFHGHGYAREAMQTFLPYVFEKLGIGAVTATCDAADQASWTLMKRLGMHLVEKSDDQLQYALTRDRPTSAGG